MVFILFDIKIDLEKRLKYAERVCSGVIFGKELVNAPANVLTPGQFFVVLQPLFHLHLTILPSILSVYHMLHSMACVDSKFSHLMLVSHVRNC